MMVQTHLIGKKKVILGGFRKGTIVESTGIVKLLYSIGYTVLLLFYILLIAMLYVFKCIWFNYPCTPVNKTIIMLITLGLYKFDY